MRKFRFVGPQPVVFQAPVGPVNPGDEFEVAGAVADRFAQHGEVVEITAEHVPTPTPTPAAKTTKK